MLKWLRKRQAVPQDKKSRKVKPGREEITSLLLMGRMLANHVKEHGIYENLHDAEFKVFSQFGDDGILQYLIHQTQPKKHTFIEFGVQAYTEANTRFLLLNDNWSGLIMDGDHTSMEAVRNLPDIWRYDLQAVGAFIDRDNVNSLFASAGYTGEIGLLSVDIDGNDYWVWEAINVVDPVLVVAEYNSVFGAEHAVTVPYNPAFDRTRSHYSNLYWGASLKALCLLAEKKGYAFVGCNSAGNNAHFVRKDRVGNIPVRTVKEGYVESKFRESRDADSNLTYLRGSQRLKEIQDMNVVDVENNKTLLLSELT
ncbi:MAG: hypothetical protein KDD74_18655 [Anaerolineales bacterium]|nr:hypothetical protein [Anaerolineales bacterium]